MTSTQTVGYEVVPVSPLLGAELVGLDLADGIDDATAQALREDFWRHEALAFRDQHLTPDEHVDAVRIFDEPFDHPQWLQRDEVNRLVYMFAFEKAGGAWS